LIHQVGNASEEEEKGEQRDISRVVLGYEGSVFKVVKLCEESDRLMGCCAM
jgi:hypothetical protein